ncbi:MAG: hypothetical protein LIP04_02650 [Tannerellaceae bacterium]|nr:hypothetical protein [Tannerellaceae bacterium]
MALKYHLVRRPDLRKTASEGDTLLFPQVRTSDRISFRDLCENLSHLSSASPPDVSCVLRGLLYIMRRELRKGNVVELGDVGNFRMTAGSKGVEDPEEFHTSMFKRPRVVYSPGVLVKEVAPKVSFKKVDVKAVDSTCDRPHAI